MLVVLCQSMSPSRRFGLLFCAVLWFVVQVVVRKNPDATTDEERSRLETVGRFHTGVFINRISQGSLVSTPCHLAAYACMRHDSPTLA
jgi:hypothetical protein